MSYAYYNTTGLVLSSEVEGESKTFISVLTPEYGLIFAEARGLSKPESKLRYSLDPFTEGDFSFIRGKSGWRIVNARPVVHWFHQLKGEVSRRETALRVLRLAYSHIPRDQEEVKAFEIVMDFLRVIKSAPLNDLVFIETYSVFHLLATLGYVATTESVPYAPWSENMLTDIAISKSNMVKSINKALSSSHLS